MRKYVVELNVWLVLVCGLFAASAAAQEKRITAADFYSATNKAQADVRKIYPRRETMFGDNEAKKYVMEYESADKHRFYLTSIFEDGTKHRLDELTIGGKLYTGFDGVKWTCEILAVQVAEAAAERRHDFSSLPKTRSTPRTASR